MSEQLLTKCPHCGTTFRLSKEHLAIAGGAVRCGACYQVFHAKEHIVKTAVIESNQPEQPVAPRPDPFKELENEASDDPYATMDNLAWEDTSSPDDDLFNEDYYNKPAEDDPLFSSLGYQQDTPKSNDPASDEAWAEQLLQELDSEPETTPDLIADDPEKDGGFVSGMGQITSSQHAFDEELQKAAGTDDEFSDTFLNLERKTQESSFDVDDEETTNTDEDWAKKMLAELEAEDQPPPPAMDELSILKEEPETPEATPKTEDDQFVLEQELAKSTEPPNEKGAKPIESDDFLESLKVQAADIEVDDLSDFEQDDSLFAEPIIEAPRPKEPASSAPKKQSTKKPPEMKAWAGVSKVPYVLKRILAQLTWVSVNLIAGLGLVAQYAIYNIDTLSKQERFRPHYELACKHLHCHLPPITDISKIKGTNLIVRSHPVEPNALSIDAIMHNEAPFSQPYPAVELTFQDINGNTLAQRRFEPEEYIVNDKIDPMHMPSQVPVRLHLEIIDPGPRAVNYELKFYKARIAR